MSKLVTLKKNKDFNRLYAKGKSFVSPSLVMYVSKNKLGCTRIGITTSKKIGKAVDRNRARRVIKESYRKIAPFVKDGLDLVFVARGKTTHVKSDVVLKAMIEILESINVLHIN